jgi:tyrosyl-tRNA synthetase
MLTAEGYRQRMEKGLSFLEFNYQLLQAYDFLVLNQKYGCTLQIGGDDQWGNILAGVDLIRRKQASQAFALTQPLLLTSSGQKMGKTHAGAVWIDANRMSPFDFFQYWVNTDDRDVVRFLKLYTFLSAERIAELEQLQGADIRLAKGVLAWEITALLHGEAAANEARDAAVAMVAGAATDDLPTFSVAEDALQLGMPIFAILADSGIAKSRSEGRRLIQGGAVRVGNDKVSDPDAVLRSEQVDASGIVVRVGKKHAVRVVRS